MPWLMTVETPNAFPLFTVNFIGTFALFAWFRLLLIRRRAVLTSSPLPGLSLVRPLVMYLLLASRHTIKHSCKLLQLLMKPVHVFPYLRVMLNLRLQHFPEGWGSHRLQ